MTSNKMVYWIFGVLIYISYRSLKSLAVGLPKDKGAAKVAINEWLSYFNVRLNHIEITGGQDVIIKLEPVKHVASEIFRELSLDKRKCKFPDEVF